MAPLLLPRSALLPNAMDSSAKVMAKSFDELHEMWRVYCDRHRIGGPELFRRSDELALLWQANADFRNDQQTLLLHLRQEQLFEVQEQFLLQLRQKQLFEVQEQLQPPQEQLQPPQQQTKPAYSKPWPRRAMRKRVHAMQNKTTAPIAAPA